MFPHVRVHVQGCGGGASYHRCTACLFGQVDRNEVVLEGGTADAFEQRHDFEAIAHPAYVHPHAPVGTTAKGETWSAIEPQNNGDARLVGCLRRRNRAFHLGDVDRSFSRMRTETCAVEQLTVTTGGEQEKPAGDRSATVQHNVNRRFSKMDVDDERFFVERRPAFCCSLDQGMVELGPIDEISDGVVELRLGTFGKIGAMKRRMPKRAGEQLFRVDAEIGKKRRDVRSEPTATGYRAREFRAIHEGDVSPGIGQQDGSRRPGGPGADDGNVARVVAHRQPFGCAAPDRTEFDDPDQNDGGHSTPRGRSRRNPPPAWSFRRPTASGVHFG